jgi:hypothetical protein
LPLAQIATAIPRRFTNQSEVSATSGENVAEPPSNPSSRQWAALKTAKLDVAAASQKPAPMPHAPTMSGTVTPNRSESRPMKRPPMPNPIISSE